MKKIMFDDRFGLTQAVLDGRKTMTRRTITGITPEDSEYLETAFDWDLRESVIIDRYAHYKPGEVVAVAQPYKDVIYTGGLPHPLVVKPGWTNKMFVRADLMPHQIRITSIRVERIQDISRDDCLREGIIDGKVEPKLYGFKNGKHYDTAHTPREAFAILIKKMAGKKAWDDNPWVFVYEFELIR